MMDQAFSTAASSARQRFRTNVERFGAAAKPLILGHFDADGLSSVAILAPSVAILARSLARFGRPADIRLVGKGENPWSPAMREELSRRAPGGLIVADLGVRDGEPAPDVPTVIIDHHVPTGVPGEACVIFGHRLDPEPTSSLLAFWCAEGLGSADDLLWLAALGIIGDMAEASGFAEMTEAQQRYGKTALRNAVSLIKAPRRAASADASPALALLMKENGPKDVLSGEYSETADLLAAKAEVKGELESAKRVGPKVRGTADNRRSAGHRSVHGSKARQRPRNERRHFLFWCLNPERPELRPTLERFLQPGRPGSGRRSTSHRLERRCGR